MKTEQSTEQPKFTDMMRLPGEIHELTEELRRLNDNLQRMDDLVEVMADLREILAPWLGYKVVERESVNKHLYVDNS